MSATHEGKSLKDEGCDLMLRVQQDDEAAFESLVDLYQKPVIGAIYRYLGDAARAEDLAQEVFLRVYRSRKSYKPLAKFKTWLFRILYNLVVNEAGARKRRRAVSLDSLRGEEEGGITLEDPRATQPAEKMERAELMKKVKEVVFRLPEKQRMALVMNKYEDMSYIQIAEAMDMSVEAVKSLLFRAREKVREGLVRYLKIEVPHEM